MLFWCAVTGLLVCSICIVKTVAKLHIQELIPSVEDGMIKTKSSVVISPKFVFIANTPNQPYGFSFVGDLNVLDKLLTKVLVRKQANANSVITAGFLFGGRGHTPCTGIFGHLIKKIFLGCEKWKVSFVKRRRWTEVLKRYYGFYVGLIQRGIHWIRESYWAGNSYPRTMATSEFLTSRSGGTFGRMPDRQGYRSIDSEQYSGNNFYSVSFLIASILIFFSGFPLFIWGWGWWSGIYSHPKGSWVLADISCLAGGIFWIVGAFGILLWWGSKL